MFLSFARCYALLRTDSTSYKCVLPARARARCYAAAARTRARMQPQPFVAWQQRLYPSPCPSQPWQQPSAPCGARPSEEGIYCVVVVDDDPIVDTR